jgi:GDP-L-fucose synthase
MIKEIVGFQGKLRFNTDAPDGMPRRVLDVSRLTALGWRPSYSLRKGLSATYQWYVENDDRLRK